MNRQDRLTYGNAPYSMQGRDKSPDTVTCYSSHQARYHLLSSIAEINVKEKVWNPDSFHEKRNGNCEIALSVRP